MASDYKIVKARLESVVNHVTLPPQLPGRKDPLLPQTQTRFIEYLLSAISHIGPHGEYDALRRGLQAAKVLNSGGRLQASTLLDAFQQLQSGELLTLHVVEQNCGLLIRRDSNTSRDLVYFEAFELSPPATTVLAAEGALECQYPNIAVSIPLSRFSEPKFQHELADFLDKACNESVKRFAAHVTKAGSSVYESRDTADPALITQFLMTLLESCGTREYPTILSKRIHDEVQWEGSDPFRRSPFWLLLRVAIQRHLYAKLGDQDGRVVYKFILCAMTAHLLDECLMYLMPDVLHHIKAKLCRKLVKLETEHGSSSLDSLYSKISRLLRKKLTMSVESATQCIQTRWSEFREGVRRKVDSLPKFADERHLHLSLHRSGAYIDQVLRGRTAYTASSTPQWTKNLPTSYDPSSKSSRPMMQFTSLYQNLQAQEDQSLRVAQQISRQCYPRSEEALANCAHHIENYMSATSVAYTLNAEQNSTKVLTLLDLWLAMDSCAIELYPLLREFIPPFTTTMLDVLQLPRLQDMERLHRIRTYLSQRTQDVTGPRLTIFSPLDKNCFAVRYYKESADSDNLKVLHQQIEEHTLQMRSDKSEEWRRLSRDHELLVAKIAASTCVYITDDEMNVVHNQHCKRCYLERQERRCRITAHEDPLPQDQTQSSAIIFELNCPEAFARYRHLTWKIITNLGMSQPEWRAEPHVLLDDYPGLDAFHHSDSFQFVLASSTKSFLKTHYASQKLPVALDDICLPCGLNFKYYDSCARAWVPTQFPPLSLSTQCQLLLPPTSPFAALQFDPDFTVGAKGPTSYQVVCSQTKCPSGLNVHEFMAYQMLFSGAHRRWPQILIELGSSSLNFGSESVAALMALLALQIGPQSDDARGVIHEVFQDEEFYGRLSDQISQRLENISTNYRETTAMEVLITILLRIVELSRHSQQAGLLLTRAAKITHSWAILLRAEVHQTFDADASRRYSEYALWSALLHRRTLPAGVLENGLISADHLQDFVDCAMIMQENLNSDPSKISQRLRNAIVRDIKNTYILRQEIELSLRANPSVLHATVASIYGLTPQKAVAMISSIEFNQPSGWVTMTTLGGEDSFIQVVQLHMLDGHLLIMGEPVGKLPGNYRESTILHKLFGSQTLLTFPSQLAGMSHRLAITPHNHQVHIGYRDKEIVVRVCYENNVYEILPTHIFGIDDTSFDLPRPLVDGHVH